VEGLEAAAKYQDRAKTKLIASVAAISTDEAVEYAKTAKELGYDAMISTVPYYYKFGMKAISEYYNTLRETVDLPLFLYNFPGNTGVERRRQFDKHAILQYRLMLGLFSHRLSRKYFREVHGVNLDRTLMKEMLALRVAGAIKDDPNDPDNIIVTDGGKFLGLVMMKAFYSAMDNVRAELRQPLKEEDYS